MQVERNRVFDQNKSALRPKHLRQERLHVTNRLPSGFRVVSDGRAPREAGGVHSRGLTGRRVDHLPELLLHEVRPLMLQSYNSSRLSQLSADGREIARGRRGAVGEAQEVITMISTRGALFALMLAALSTTGCSSPVLVVKSLRGLIPVEALRRLAIARTGYSSPPVRAPLTCQDRLRPTAPPRTTPVAHEQSLLNR